jgi:hypothetical protein
VTWEQTVLSDLRVITEALRFLKCSPGSSERAEKQDREIALRRLARQRRRSYQIAKLSQAGLTIVDATRVVDSQNA